MNGRQFNNGTYAYQTYKAYNVIDDIINFFTPQTASAQLFRPPTPSTFLKDLPKVAKNEGMGKLEESIKEIINRPAFKHSCDTPCDAAYVRERTVDYRGSTPRYTNYCYCRKRGNIVEEIVRGLEDFFEKAINPSIQTAEAIKDYGSNCFYYPKSSGYPNGRFCWRNKPCGKSSAVAICTNGGNCSSARTRWIYNYGCKKTVGTSSTKTTNTGTKTSTGTKTFPSGKPCPACAKGYTRGSSGCSCKACSPCGMGYIRGSSGCSCKKCSPCRSGYHRGKSGCSCVQDAALKCQYSGCTSLNRGSTCYYCRCAKLCKGKGGVKTVKGDGSCFCKGTSSSGGSSGGCSTYLKQRCGNICVQKGKRPYLDSKCSCFCK